MKATALLSCSFLSLLFWGCGDEPETTTEHIDAVQTQLDKGDLEGAGAQANSTLEGVDPISAEGLQLQGQKLEILARSGDTEASSTLLKQLHTDHPQQFGYEEFLVVGAWLAEAGDCSGAVDLLAYGDETIEGHSTVFEEAVLSAGGACGGGDDELLQQLQSLGYI
jgi:hypothetical protein